MRKTMLAVFIAAGLLAAPLPQIAQTAFAQSEKKAEKKAEKPKKEPSAGMQAMRERQKKCGAEWKDAKASGKVEKGMKWPQYWSACNKRLKAA
jgi:sortase (surface protein transpeptidase)